MKQRSLLANDSEILAFLKCVKYQIRRPIKQQPGLFLDARIDRARLTEDGFIEFVTNDGIIKQGGKRCPYGVPGDQLYVRERFSVLGQDSNGYQIQYGVDNSTKWIDDEYICSLAGSPKQAENWIYSASTLAQAKTKMLSSTCMPKWASRIFLPIGEIKVERLQDLTNSDAWREGCPSNILRGRIRQQVAKNEWFPSYWDKHFAKKGYPYRSNPWVYVVLLSSWELEND